MTPAELLRPIRMTIYKAVSYVVDRRLRPLGWTPIQERHERDVYIVGFPKSGHNWMQNIATGLIYGLQPGALPDSLVQDLIPDIDYQPRYRRHFSETVFRTHSLPRPELRRVIYLLRDPRDVFVSNLHYLRAVQEESLTPLELLQDPKESGIGWREHVESWLANPFGAEILVIKFEDLSANPVGECLRILKHLQVERTHSEIEQVVEQTTFERLRSKERRFGKANPPEWPRSKPFYRRGRVGSYRDEISPQILERLLAQVGPTLQSCGYSDSDGKPESE